MKIKSGILSWLSVFVLALIAATIWVSHDIPAVEDHGLGTEPAVLAADKNASPLLMDTTNVWVKPPGWVQEWTLAGTNWDAAGASNLVAANAAFFARMDQALARESFQSPIRKKFADLMPWVHPYRDMGRLLKVKSEWHRRRGEMAPAVDSAVKLVLLGHLIQSGSGSLIEFLVGDAVQNMGLDQVLAVGLVLDSPESVRVLGKLLDSYRDDSAGLESALRGEYRMESEALDLLARGDLTLMEMAAESDAPPLSLKSGAWMPRWLRQGLIRLMLHPNRTKQRFADYEAEMIWGCSAPLQKAFGPIAAKRRAHAREFEAGGVARLMHRNPAGLILLEFMLPAKDVVREKVAEAECKAGGVRLVLALRAYELEKSAWPDKLEALVPDYLPALPRDPYDGAPSFRYAPSKRLVYAVGPDFKDDGGEEGKDIGWQAGK
jgi:hypothetical protein